MNSRSRLWPTDVTLLAPKRPVSIAGAASLTELLLISVLLTVGSMSPLAALGAGAIVAIQSFGGVLLYLHVFPAQVDSFGRILGVGTTLGLLLAIASSQFFFLVFNLKSFGWWAPTAVLLLLPASWREHHVGAGPGQRKAWRFVFLSAIPGFLSLLMIWRIWPIAGTEWWPVDGDLSSHGHVAASVGSSGAENSLALLGSGFQYHWFSHAWVDLFTVVITHNFLISFTRVLFAVCFVTAIALFWAITGLISRDISIRAFGVAMGSTASYLTIGTAHGGSLLVEPLSPTFTFGLVVFLATTVVTIDLYRTSEASRRRQATQIAIGAFLVFSLIGSRVFFAGVLFGGLSALFAVALFIRKGRILALVYFLVSGLATVAAYKLITYPTTLRATADGLKLELNWDLPSLLGSIPDNSSLGLALGMVSAAVAALAGGAGLLWFFIRQGRPKTPSGVLLVAWVLGGVVIGIGATFLSRQGGYSQMSFLASAAVLVFLTSGVGAASGIFYLVRVKAFGPRSTRGITLWLVAPAVVGIANAFTWPFIQGFRFSGVVRFSVPFAICLAVFLYAVSTVHMAKIRTRAASVILFSSALTVVVFTTSVMNVVLRLPVKEVQVDPYSAFALSQEYFEAGFWAQNATPTSSIFATNRQCDLPTDTFPNCSSGTFIVSALARRQVITEGHSYSLGFDVESIRSERPLQSEWIVASTEFGRAPNSESFGILREAGVDYFWVDKLVPHAESWDSYARMVFENERIIVLELAS